MVSKMAREPATGNKVEAFIRQCVRPQIRALQAYHVPDAAGFIKLDAMENPYPWPQALRDEWQQLLCSASLNRYPDPNARELVSQLRESMNVPESAEILLGNGSDELIQMIGLAVGMPQRTLIAPEPSFVMYRMVAVFVGMQYVGVNLRSSDFGLDLPALLAAIEQEKPAVVFLAYPNNPTGNLFDAEDLERVVAATPGLVIIDEAYAPFAQASFLERLGDFPNLLIMRTLSKLGLAGLRLGLLIGHARWINELNKVRLPYNINTLSQLSAAFAMVHRDVFEDQAAAIRDERRRLLEALADLPGLKVYPSRTNFILMRMPPDTAGMIFEGLKSAGILVKNLHGSSPLLSDCLRVTVGLPEENDAFLAQLPRCLDEIL